jgi:hypothetical protein
MATKVLKPEFWRIRSRKLRTVSGCKWRLQWGGAVSAIPGIMIFRFSHHRSAAGFGFIAMKADLEPS